MKIPLPTLDPSTVCPPCARCCRHVAVGIDPPTTVDAVSTALWLLYHRSVSIYQAHDGEWFLMLNAVCDNLRPDGLCSVYENRPLICRDYEVDGCEGTSPEPAEKVRFDDAGSLLAWLARKRPAVYRRCLARGLVPKELAPEVP